MDSCLWPQTFPDARNVKHGVDDVVLCHKSLYCCEQTDLHQLGAETTHEARLLQWCLVVLFEHQFVHFFDSGT